MCNEFRILVSLLAIISGSPLAIRGSPLQSREIQALGISLQTKTEQRKIASMARDRISKCRGESNTTG